MQPDVQMANDIEEAQQKIFGTLKKQHLLEEQNYTSRP
jgi:hypothetical protein